MKREGIGFLSFLVVTVALMLPQSTSAAETGELTAQGWGSSRDKACRQALASLAESLQVRVRSEFEMRTESRRTDDGPRETDVQSSQDVVTRADLPILGADRKATRRDGQFVCNVRLVPDRAGRYYEDRLADLRKEVADVERELAGAKSESERYRLLTDLLATLDRYRQFAVVARFLGVEAPPAGERTAAELRTALSRLQSSLPSLDAAAAQLTRELTDAPVFVTPPRPSSSREVTPFARTLMNEIAAELTTTETPEAAVYRYRGEYQSTEKGITVTYRLIDDDGVIREVRTADLAAGAYDHLRTEPRTADFDRLLHQGLAVDDDFRADIATAKGQNDLLFRAGEEVELLIKLNRPGYYYLTGHTIRDGESYSYIVPLQDARGAQRFVRYMDAENTNKWVSLGAFEVSPPFGVESIQMVASSRDLVGDLPSYEYDDEKGLYMLDGDAGDGVRKTRALIPKKKEKVRSTEAVLMFTTAPAS